MNILVVCNKNYIYATQVLILSVMMNHKEKIHFHLLYGELEDTDILSFQKLCAEYGSEFSACFIGRDTFRESNLIQENRVLSAEIYFRLLMGEVLPDAIDRILYLDTDIIVNQDISSFYHMDLQDHTAAVCEDFGLFLRRKSRREVYENLGFHKKEKYFNSGVMLIDLKRWRIHYSWQQIRRLLDQGEIRFLFHDQCILNYLLRGDLLYADFNRYNCRPFYYPESWAGQRMLKRAAIIHYGVKPWEEDFYGPGKEIFDRYAGLLPENQGNFQKSLKKSDKKPFSMKLYAAWILYWMERIGRERA